MKIDLILENIRNQYTLGLIEESTIEGLDEKIVLKGKMLINESTMELRKMLIQEGVMNDVRSMLHNSFARIIEESEFDDLINYSDNAQARADLQSQLDAKNAAYADLDAKYNNTIDAKYINPAIAAGQNVADQARAAANEAYGQARTAIQPGIDAAGQAYDQARTAIQPGIDAAGQAYDQARAAAQPAVDAYNRATPYEVASIPAAAAIGYGAYRLGQRSRR